MKELEKNVKEILFRMEIKGYGVVNFDSNEQKYTFPKNEPKLNHLYDKNNNVSYAKKHYYEDEDGNIDYNLKISDVALRHGIFQKDLVSQNPNVMANDYLLYGFLASPMALLRGSLLLGKDAVNQLKNSSVFTLTDAEQICGAKSKLDFYSRSGKKNEDENEKDTSIYKKETVGDITYAAKGSIDLEKLQFYSCDDVFDRYGFNPDKFELFKSFLERTFNGNFNSELEYYLKNTSTIEIPEYGFKLSDENIIFLVKEFFTRVLAMNIRKKSGFARTSKVQYKLVTNPIVHTFDNEDDWHTLTSNEDIDNIDFNIHEFYSLMDFEKAVESRKDLEEYIMSQKKKSKEKKAASAKLKEAKIKEKV